MFVVLLVNPELIDTGSKQAFPFVAEYGSGLGNGGQGTPDADGEAASTMPIKAIKRPENRVSNIATLSKSPNSLAE